MTEILKFVRVGRRAMKKVFTEKGWKTLEEKYALTKVALSSDNDRDKSEEEESRFDRKLEQQKTYILPKDSLSFKKAQSVPMPVAPSKPTTRASEAPKQQIQMQQPKVQEVSKPVKKKRKEHRKTQSAQ